MKKMRLRKVSTMLINKAESAFKYLASNLRFLNYWPRAYITVNISDSYYRYQVIITQGERNICLNIYFYDT